jgi:hypothetical protein
VFFPAAFNTKKTARRTSSVRDGSGKETYPGDLLWLNPKSASIKRVGENPVKQARIRKRRAHAGGVLMAHNESTAAICVSSAIDSQIPASLWTAAIGNFFSSKPIDAL